MASLLQFKSWTQLDPNTRHGTIWQAELPLCQSVPAVDSWTSRVKGYFMLTLSQFQLPGTKQSINSPGQTTRTEGKPLQHGWTQSCYGLLLSSVPYYLQFLSFLKYNLYSLFLVFSTSWVRICIVLMYYRTSFNSIFSFKLGGEGNDGGSGTRVLIEMDDQILAGLGSEMNGTEGLIVKVQCNLSMGFGKSIQ